MFVDLSSRGSWCGLIIVLLGAHTSLLETKNFGVVCCIRGSSTECHSASLELPLASGHVRHCLVRGSLRGMSILLER